VEIKAKEVGMQKRLWNGYSLIWKILVLFLSLSYSSSSSTDGLFPQDIDAPLAPASSAGSAEVSVSEDQIAMLADMGFTSAQAKKALKETGGNPERAVEWLFNHPDDTGESSDSSAPAGAQKELPGSKVVPAQYRLKAFISHKGPSVHSGHYVAHIRVNEDKWVLFNDEKVVKADKESVDALKKLAYLYVFERL
jgi:ubiquitin carboxyl-terminal hydrolase 5/13